MKCISIDLDGTLLNSQHEISEKNVKTLRDLHEQGHSIILNTGRAYADVIKLKAVQNMEVPIFCINGSILYSKQENCCMRQLYLFLHIKKYFQF
ncbi:HAD family hydrolase [Priestia aryabhattai]|uniref:HAD family hydrolase n=1 Tax=Priestia aryabhattai TaxID=412384 RepID=UPI003D2B1788